MLQSLAKCGRTRRATAGLAFSPALSTAHAPKRFYAAGKNEDLVNLLRKCETEEEASLTRNRYKIRSFRTAAAAIEKIDFRVQHGDELKMRGVGPGIRSRINAFLGVEESSPIKQKSPPINPEALRRKVAIKNLTTISGLGVKLAKTLYDNGCDTIAKLYLKEYQETLSPGTKRSLKYLKHSQCPVPKEYAEQIVEFCKHFTKMSEYEVVITGEYHRGAATLSEPINLLVIDKSAADSIPTPPHPSTLKLPGPSKPKRAGLPFKQYYTREGAKRQPSLLNKILWSLKNLGVISDTVTLGTNLWEGWVRVPKKDQSWESREQRVERIKNLDGDFHRMNITCVPGKSRGAALLALTGDGDFYFDCTRKAFKAGLYLNEWGLWQWEPHPDSLSRFQTSDAPHEKTSLGAIWGSETEEDKGRWIQLDAFEEEQIFEHIGAAYVPPKKRNWRFIGEKKSERHRFPVATPDL